MRSMLANETSSTNTCGASRMSAATRDGDSAAADERNRSAVAVAKKNGAPDAGRVEDLGQQTRLLVHEADRVWHGRRIGLAVTEAAVGQDPTVRYARPALAESRATAPPSQALV